MKSIKLFFQNFLKRAGNYVFIATILSRLLSFLTSWIALQYIDNEKLGVVLFSWNIITFILPFAGLGLSQSLIRYGALLTKKEDKKSLLYYVVKNGLIASFLLSILTWIIAFTIPFRFEQTALYIGLFSISFIPYFLVETIKIQLRLEHKNKTFSIVDTLYNILLCTLVFVLSYFFKENGYIAALLITPSIIAVIFFNRIYIKKQSVKKLKETDFSFWKYGFFSALTGVTSVLLFTIDILLIGTITNNSEQVTNYRYVSLIPMSLLFLSRVFITTDFVAFTEKIHQKNYIFNYIKSYITTFTLISALICCILFIGAPTFLSLFHPLFVKYTDSFKILTFGVCGILIFRGIFGNLLCSIGHIKINYYITVVALFINVISNYILIPRYGIKGAAITSTTLMWCTGIATCFIFLKLYKKFNHEKTL